MRKFNSFNQKQIRERNTFAYEACIALANGGYLSKFLNTVESYAKLEWHQSLVKVHFNEVTVNVYFNEISGTVEEICFSAE